WCGSLIPEAYSAPSVELAARAPRRRPTIRASHRSATGSSPNTQGSGEGMSVLPPAIKRAPTRIAPIARNAFPSESVRPGSAILLTGERQERENACALHSLGDLGLVAGAGARNPTRNDLPAIRDEAREPAVVLVVDPVDLVEAKLAEFPSKRSRFAFTAHGSLSSSMRSPRPPQRSPRRGPVLRPSAAIPSLRGRSDAGARSRSSESGGPSRRSAPAGS